MKRYFYTNPLAAAWMLENHGFKITYLDRAIKSEQITGGDLFPPFYIHPDSLHLLEPEVSDMDKSGFVITAVGEDRVLVESKSARFARQVDIRDIEVIQRNGKAFHWPESEDVN